MGSSDAENRQWRAIVPVDSLPDEGWRGAIEAPPAALPAIAKRIDTPKVIAVRGDFELRPISRGVRLSGVLDATLERLCVASLEPMEEIIHEPFEVTFTRETGGGNALELDLEEDAPDPLEAPEIDLADLLIQQLSLAMAPYPRKPQAASLVQEFGGTGRISPFEVLKSKIADGGEQG